MKRTPEPSTKLVHFKATDDVSLAGLLYEPRRPTNRALLWLHGNGGASVFDSRRTNALARQILARGFAFFPFNNRGAHLLRWVKKGDTRVKAGMAHELIRDCVADIDGAARELRRRGYRELHLAGHSTGANKIAVYDHHKPRNTIRRYVFVAGGDDTGLLYANLGAKRFAAALEEAKEAIAAGRGDELLPPRLSQTPLSWRSFYDIGNPNGDYNVFPYFEVLRGLRLGTQPRFRHIRAIRKPSLYIYGDRDEYCYGAVPRCVAALSEHVGPKSEIVVIRDCDHGFGGHEDELGELIAEWLSE